MQMTKEKLEQIHEAHDFDQLRKFAFNLAREAEILKQDFRYKATVANITLEKLKETQISIKQMENDLDDLKRLFEKVQGRKQC